MRQFLNMEAMKEAGAALARRTPSALPPFAENFASLRSDAHGFPVSLSDRLDREAETDWVSEMFERGWSL